MAYTLVQSELIADNAITSAKLDTNIAVSGTLNVTGVTTLATHLVMGDNDKIKIGTGGDLEIYHDASNSYIVNSTGNLYIGDTNGNVHIQAKLNEDSIVATADGAVTLFHNNVAKLATASAGVTVTGVVTATSLDISGNIDVDGVTNLDVVDIDGAVDMASTLTVAGAISSGRIVANGGSNQHEFTSSSDAPVITKSTDATTGVGFTDNSATNFLFYRGSLNHFYTNSGTLGVAVASVGSGQALNVAGGIGISSTTVIDASRNLTNIGTIASGAITSTGLDISGNIDVDGITNLDVVDIDGLITLAGATGGTRTVKDSYSNGALSNQGFLRSSGGNYWGYGAYQDGSANWKSAVSIALERSVYAMDEDTAYWSFAPSQTVAIGSDLTTQPAEKIRFDLQNGRVGIGIDAPDSILHLFGAESGEGASVGQLRVQSSTVFGSSPKAGVVFTNQHASGSQAIMGGIYVGKDSTTSGNYAGHMAFSTRAQGAVSVERMRILSNGYVGIGTSIPTGKLQIGNDWTINGSYGNSSLFIKASSPIADGDPRVVSTADIGLIITSTSTNTSGPDKAGLVLHNDNTTAGAYSPMLLFTKRESANSPFKATMAGIWAEAPTGTGNSDSWIDGQLHFGTAGAATAGVVSNMVIDKEGKVGIAKVAPTSNLHIGASGADAKREIRIDGTNGSSQTYGLIIQADGENGRAVFKVGQGNGTPAQKLMIHPDGGICFNTDTAAANALDDYEEGTWTPVLRKLNGQIATHTAQIGSYTKIGNFVHVHGTIQTSGNSDSGALTIISGLPFSSLAGSGKRNAGSMGALSGCGGTAENLRLVCDPDTTFAYLLLQSGQNYTHDAGLNDAVNIFGFSLVYSAA